MRKFITCFLFHLKEAVLKKAAIIMAVVSFVATVAVFGAIHWFSQNSDATEIVIIENSAVYTLDANLLAIEGVNFSFKPYSELDELNGALEERDIDHIYVIEGDQFPLITSLHRESSHMESDMLLSHLLQQQYLTQVMMEHNLSVEVAEQLLRPIEIQNEALRDQEEALQSYVISYVFTFALYMILLICGQNIAMNIVTEKSSRVMEVMTSKVKPLYMMFAKILSVLSVLLLNVLSLGAAVLVANVIGWVNLASLFDFILSILDLQTIALGVTFVFLGYFLYGMLFAAAGAMCSQVETMQSVITPLIAAIMIPFFLALSVPEHSVVLTIASYIPFFSPFITFDRFVSGTAGMIEVSIVLGLMVISIVVMGKIAARLYVNGVLHYSDKVSFKDVKRLLQRQ